MGTCANACNGKNKRSKKGFPKDIHPPETIPDVNKITGDEPNPNEDRPIGQLTAVEGVPFTDVELEPKEPTIVEINENDKETNLLLITEEFNGDYVDLQEENPVVKHGKPLVITPYTIPLSALQSNSLGEKVKANLREKEELIERTELEAKAVIKEGLKIFQTTFDSYHEDLQEKVKELDVESWIAEGSNVVQFRNIVPQQNKAFEAWSKNPLDEDLLEQFTSYSYLLMDKFSTLTFDKEKIDSFEVKVEDGNKLGDLKVFLAELGDSIMSDIKNALSNLSSGVDGVPNLLMNLDSLRQTTKSIHNSDGYNNTHFSTILIPKDNLIVSGWSQKVKGGHKLFFQVHSGVNMELLQQIELEQKVQNEDSLRLAFSSATGQLWVSQSSLPLIFKYVLGKDNRFSCNEKVRLPEEIGGLDSIHLVEDSNIIFANSSNKGLVLFDTENQLLREFGVKANMYLRINKQILLIGGFKELLAYNLDLEQLVMRTEIHTDYINGIAYFPESNTLLTGGWDNFIHKYEIQLAENGGFSLNLLEEFRPTGNTVFTMVPINSEEVIFSSRDNYIYLYNYKTGKRLRKKFPVEAEITSFVLNIKRATIYAKVGFKTIVMIN